MWQTSLVSPQQFFLGVSQNNCHCVDEKEKGGKKNDLSIPHNIFKQKNMAETWLLILLPMLL
jgi:hypothetical protein